MTDRTLVLFVHVVGALALFAAIGVELSVLLQLRGAATADRARQALQGFHITRILGPVALGLTVLPGLYLTATVWGWQTPWIGLAMGSVVLVAVVGGTMTALPVTRLERSGDALLVTLPRNARTLWMGFLLRSAILLGIVFLMVTKPVLVAGVTALAIALVLGLAVSSALSKRLSRVA